MRAITVGTMYGPIQKFVAKGDYWSISFEVRDGVLVIVDHYCPGPLALPSPRDRVAFARGAWTYVEVEDT